MAIWSDSVDQSSLSSCTMQRESIQRYLIPSPLVMSTASLYVLGKADKGISCFLASKVSAVVVSVGTPPQQWLRVAYGTLSPCEMCRCGSSFSAPTSITLPGSRDPFWPAGGEQFSCSELHVDIQSLTVLTRSSLSGYGHQEDGVTPSKKPGLLMPSGIRTSILVRPHIPIFRLLNRYL